MNKVVTSAGLLAISAATVFGLDPEMTRAKSGRPFTVAATVRGFYDDNSTTSPDRIFALRDNGTTRVVDPRQESFGFEVSPSIHVNLPLEQTFIRAGYVYSLRYYDGRSDNQVDQSHEFNALLRHAFNARHDISLTDSFTYSSEPTVTDRFGIITAPTTLRSDITVLHNRAALDYNIALTQVLGLALGYGNHWYDYDDAGRGSRSARLDRLEHLIHADLRYQFNPSLVGILGYQFGMNSYIGDKPIYEAPLAPPVKTSLQDPKSDIRDSYSHYVYAGVDHDFSHKLRGSVRLGGQFIDYHEMGDSQVSPYAEASLTYVYLPESSVQVGVRHARNATDITAPDKKGNLTLDQETTAGFVQLTHRITTDLTGSLIGQVQHSTFNGGTVDGKSENLYLLGINFEYRINHHWSVELGYNYDMLDSSDITTQDPNPPFRTLESRSYDRSRVYVGVRASY